MRIADHPVSATKPILEKISEVARLVRLTNELVGSLLGDGVIVDFGTRPRRSDPLGAPVSVTVSLTFTGGGGDDDSPAGD